MLIATLYSYYNSFSFLIDVIWYGLNEKEKAERKKNNSLNNRNGCEEMTKADYALQRAVNGKNSQELELADRRLESYMAS